MLLELLRYVEIWKDLWYGNGKSKEVPVAIKKAIEKSKKNYKKVNIINDTIPHEVHGRFGASRVIIRPARKGTGVIAGGAVRVVLEAIGITNAVAKSLGSRNPLNVALATEDALMKCREIKEKKLIEKLLYQLRIINRR